eukprot:2181607-Rhodomonas_salina.3
MLVACEYRDGRRSACDAACFIDRPSESSGGVPRTRRRRAGYATRSASTGAGRCVASSCRCASSEETLYADADRSRRGQSLKQLRLAVPGCREINSYADVFAEDSAVEHLARTVWAAAIRKGRVTLDEAVQLRDSSLRKQAGAAGFEGHHIRWPWSSRGAGRISASLRRRLLRIDQLEAKVAEDRS